MRMNLRIWEVTKHEPQIVAQEFLNFFDFRMSTSAVDALEVTVLNQRYRCGRRARNVVAFVNSVLESNDFWASHNHQLPWYSDTEA